MAVILCSHLQSKDSECQGPSHGLSQAFRFARHVIDLLKYFDLISPFSSSLFSLQ
jgi:hypothetical protein